jgi:hypothetical protein
MPDRPSEGLVRALLTRLAIVSLLALAACGTPPTPTPVPLTGDALIVAWRQAGLQVAPPTSGADPDESILDSPGLVRWREFSAGGGYHYLLEYATPAQARDARDRLSGGRFWVATQRDTLVLLASQFTPIDRHARVMQELP